MDSTQRSTLARSALGLGLCLLSFGLLVPSPRAASAGDETPGARDWFVQVRDSAPGKRRTAVKGLAELGTAAAWVRVLACLADPEPEVADEAQLALGRIASAEELELLLGREGLGARDAWVRLRVAEALGRVETDVGGVELAEEARREKADVARALCWSFERLAARGRLAGDHERLVAAISKTWRMHEDPGVRAAAWRAWATLDGEDARRLVPEGLRAREPELRVAALQVEAKSTTELGADPDRLAAALATTLRWASDRAGPVRVQAVLNFEGLGTRAAALALVDRLEAESDARIREHVLRALRRLSGLRYRTDPRPWRLWATNLDADWRASPTSLALDSASDDTARGGPGQTASFAGLPVLSERVAFLIDLSGSIWREQADGKTRKQKVDEFLRTALEKLPPETRFNVIPYTTDPLPWRGRLTEARPRDVADALRTFEALRATGRGNFYDAAQLALRDPEVDCLIALTDGVPTGGRRWNLGLMVDLLLEQNRFRHVTFDAVLVDCRPGVARHWQELADCSGGRVVTVDL